MDEVFAPLDPASKAAIMRRLRAFCSHSIVIVVYHPDREAALTEGDEVCQVGEGSFDALDLTWLDLT